MRLFLSSVLIVSACGADVGTSGSSDGGDGGGSDAGGGADGALDAPVDGGAMSCDLATPWGDPALIPGVNSTGKDVYATLVDEQTIYFTSDRNGNGTADDLWTATRADASADWSGAASLAGFNTTTVVEAGAALTADGKTMFYQVAPGAGQNGEIYVATRGSTMVGFSSGQAVGPVNDASYDDGDVSVTADGGQLFFATNRNTSNGYDIYVSVRGGNGVYGAPVPVDEVNTSVYDAHPHISPDGRVLYWSSMRTDGGAEGGTDIWMASRASDTGTFGTPARVDSLSTASNESPTWLSTDGCTLYLQSNRTGTTGGNDLWFATKPLP